MQVFSLSLNTASQLVLIPLTYLETAFVPGFSAACLTAVVYGTLGESSLDQVCSGISSSCHSNKISD